MYMYLLIGFIIAICLELILVKDLLNQLHKREIPYTIFKKKIESIRFLEIIAVFTGLTISIMQSIVL